VGGPDLGNGQFPDHRIDVSRQRVLPLLPVLVIAPATLIRADVGFCNGLERNPGHLSRLSRSTRRSGLPLAFFEGINPGLDLKAESVPRIAGFGKRNAILASRSKANVPRLAVEHVAVDPRPGPLSFTSKCNPPPSAWRPGFALFTAKGVRTLLSFFGIGVPL